MKFARLEKSARLQSVLALLQDGRPHTTLDIVLNTLAANASSAISELRRNNILIDCKQVTKTRYEYKLKEN